LLTCYAQQKPPKNTPLFFKLQNGTDRSPDFAWKNGNIGDNKHPNKEANFLSLYRILSST